VKNITYYLAKLSPHILSPERFALHLAAHILAKYPHLSKATVTLHQLRWTRIPTGTPHAPHDHAFYRDGDDKRFTIAEVPYPSLLRTHPHTNAPTRSTPPTATTTSSLLSHPASKTS
jgi:urate oxidase